MRNLFFSFILILLLSLNLFAQTSVAPPTGYNAFQLRPVNCLAVDTNYDVWMGFGQIGLGKFDRYTLWTMFDTANSSLPKNNVLSVACNRVGVWAGTDSGLYNYNGTTWNWYNISNSNIPSDTIHQLYSSGGTDLFIISNSGFVYFNGSTFVQYDTSNSGLVDDTVQCILKSATGLWWIGTKHGLSSFNGSAWQSFTLTNTSLCDDNILSLNEDKNDSLFVGTNSGGAFIKSGNDFTNLDYYIDNFFYQPVTVYNQFRLSDGNILVTDPTDSVEYIVSTSPIVAIGKHYTNFNFSAPAYIYGIDRVNRIYKIEKSPFNMTYTDSISIPNTVDSVNLNNYGVYPQGMNYLDINEVKCPVFDNNTYFWDEMNDVARYYVPKSDCGQQKAAVFTSALWIGGLDPGGNLHLAAQTYRQSGNDFWDGPLDTLYATLDATTKARFDTVWKVDRDTLNQFIAQYNLGNVTNHTYQVPSEILDWPAQGSGNYAKYMAPFVDHNGDGIYNPYDGDYPEMKGDQMLWWVMNDNYSTHGETGGTPLGIEVRSEAYAYTCQSVPDSDGVVNYTTLYYDSIINRSDTDYHNVYIGIFVDPDLGYAFDDYVGCSIAGNYGFDYNGENFDPGTFGYGLNPPMLSVVLFNDTMNGFLYYVNDFAVYGNPFTAGDYYHYLRSIWLDGTHMTYGGDGYGGTDSTNYMFPGTPYDTSGWSEMTAGDVPGDRRFLMWLGPLTLKAGQSKNINYGIVFSWDSTQPNGLTTSVAKNQSDVSKIKQWYETNSFPCDHLTGINEVKKNNFNVEVYPNPASHFFYVTIPPNSSKMKLDLIDITGRIIRQQFIYPSIQNIISTENMASGVYFVRVSDSNTIAVNKLIIQ